MSGKSDRALAVRAAAAGRPVRRSNPRLPKRHPAEVTADRLRTASEQWYEKFDGAERDMIGQLAWALDQIAAGER